MLLSRYSNGKETEKNKKTLEKFLHKIYNYTGVGWIISILLIDKKERIWLPTRKLGITVTLKSI